MVSRFLLELATINSMRVHCINECDIMVNMSILRRTEVLLGRVAAYLYGCMCEWFDNEIVRGWVEVLCNIFDTTPP